MAEFNKLNNECLFAELKENTDYTIYLRKHTNGTMFLSIAESKYSKEIEPHLNNRIKPLIEIKGRKNKTLVAYHLPTTHKLYRTL